MDLKEEQNEASWSDLPIVSLVSIFEKLEFKDRFRASLVCRQWSSAFKSPVLWKKISFVFREDTMSDDTRAALSFASRFASDVRDLKLIFKGHHYPRVQEYVFNLNSFFDEIAEFSRLNHLEVRNFWLHKEMRSISLLHRVATLNSFKRMVTAQRRLEKICIAKSHFDEQDGIFILKEMVKNNKDLSQLDLTYYFHPSSQIYNHEELLESLTMLTNLKILKLSYQCFSSEVLNVICSRAVDLRILHVACHHSEELLHSISNEDWRKFQRKLPNVLFSCKLKEIARLHHFSNVLPSVVPVHGLEFKCGYTLRTEEDLQSDAIRIIQYINRSFSDHLNKLHLDFGFSSIVNLNTAIYSLCENCKRLSYIKLIGVFTPILARSLCTLALRDTSGLKELHLIFHFVSFDAVKELSLMKKYQDQLNERGIHFTFNLLPY